MRGNLLQGYQKEWLRFDAIAGVTTAAVVIPKSMALASIAGLPVQAGLYVALVPMAVYALLGSSRPLSVSTTTTIAMLTATELTHVVPNADTAQLISAAATLALLVGAFLMAAGLLRLGFLANFISDPVLTGFRAGIGLVIVVDQIPKLLGVHIDGGNFFHKVLATLQHLPETNRATLLLAAVTVTMLIGLERLRPRFPAPLAAVILGIAAASFFGLQAAGVGLTGPIPARIPIPTVPDLQLLNSLWPGALGIALMSFTESIAAGRAFAGPEDPPPAPNRELIALGAANLAGSFFQSFPAGGGTSQTAVNAHAGARSQVAELVTAAMVVATILFLSSLISALPQATLAAVVVVTTLPLLNTRDFRSILHIRRTEFLWAIAACAGVVILGTLQGILVAIGISIMTLFYQANHPPVYTLRRKPGTSVFRPHSADHPEDEAIPGLLIIKTEGRMNFASVPRARERLAVMVREAHPKVVILECSAIPDFEYTALHAMSSAEDNLRKNGIALWLSALNPHALEAVRRSPLGEAVGTACMFFDLPHAVKAFETRSSHTEATSGPAR
jgi:high affinity sulfate transporter 1